MAITPHDTVDNASYALNYKVGEQTSSARMQPKHGDAGANLDAMKAIAVLLEDDIDADIQSITAREVLYVGPVRDDSAARMSPTKFNFYYIPAGGGEADFVSFRLPWAKQSTQAAKTSLGVAIAAELSGVEGTYTFHS